MLYSEEQIQRANERSITEYFRQAGYSCKRVGSETHIEGFGGFWAYQEPELMEKIKTFEKEHNCLVYAVTHEYLEFGECYDFLYIPDYKEDWEFVLEHQGNMYFALAYVWNKDCEWCSEFGTIGIRSFGGGIKRVA